MGGCRHLALQLGKANLKLRVVSGGLRKAGADQGELKWV
jgi:hypothetical protein